MSLKVNAPLDAGLVRKAKREAQRQGRELSEILEEALDRYLVGRAAEQAGVVAASWAAIPVDADTVKRMLAEEDDVFDA